MRQALYAEILVPHVLYTYEKLRAWVDIIVRARWVDDAGYDADESGSASTETWPTTSPGGSLRPERSG